MNPDTETPVKKAKKIIFTVNVVIAYLVGLIVAIFVVACIIGNYSDSKKMEQAKKEKAALESQMK